MEGIEGKPMWIRGELLGKGGFSRVYSMQSIQTGEFYAGKFSGTELPKIGTKSRDAEKILQNLKKSNKMLADEINIHKMLEHPNIVKYISSFETTSCYEEEEIVVYDGPVGGDNKGSCKVLVLEICPNKSLLEVLKHRGTVNEDEARFYIYHLASALIYLKQQRIVHRDVKLGNIFLDANMNVKLGDFGLASKFKTRDIRGTPNYISPETLIDKTSSYPSDTWALGVCLYALLNGMPPFHTKMVETTYKKIKDLNYWIPAAFSNKAADLINKIFQFDQDRIKIKEVLQHPFFTEEPLLLQLPVAARVVEVNEKELDIVEDPRTNLEKYWILSGKLPLEKFYLYMADLKPNDKPLAFAEFTKLFNQMKK